MNEIGKKQISRIIMPPSENYRGELYGGTLLGWMDEVAGVACIEYAGTDAATVAVKEVRFLQRMLNGSMLDLTAEVIKVGNTSMEVKLEAWNRPNGPDEEPILAADGIFVYVSLGPDGKPQKIVPPEERLRQQKCKNI